MSRTAVVVVTLISALAVVGSIDAVGSDPLGFIAALWLIVGSAIAIVATYILDAAIRSFRKVHELESSERPAAPPS